MYSEHSILLLRGLTEATMPKDTILIANKNVKGILLFRLTLMMADEMNGPTKEEALPAIESTRAGILIPIR